MFATIVCLVLLAIGLLVETLELKTQLTLSKLRKTEALQAYENQIRTAPSFVPPTRKEVTDQLQNQRLLWSAHYHIEGHHYDLMGTFGWIVLILGIFQLGIMLDPRRKRPEQSVN